jgi:hypothetical protein
MSVVNAAQQGRTVCDPCPSYESINQLWEKSRAVCNGERFVKDFDGILDNLFFSNLLIPFSQSMTQTQYNFFKAEAELPGIVTQYARIIIGGLLRKQPQLKLPDTAPADAYQWIMDAFAQDSSPLVSFLDRALWEEMQTSRAWVYVDYPKVENTEGMTREDVLAIKPYPVLWNAESVINWKLSVASVDGSQILERVIVRNYEETYGVNEFHPTLLDTVWVHEIVDGYYRIRKYQKPTQNVAIPVVNGVIQQKYTVGASNGPSPSGNGGFELIETIENITSNGERLKVIPAWPLNGSIDIIEPMLTPLIDREVALYNKVSRRNHLLLGAATYTPVIAADITDEEFGAIVDAGLGSWIKLRQGDSASVLDTPTAALQDMDRAILATIEELARLGIRMLSPENMQSGVALEIRNAAQTAQLGTLNIKVSNQMADIIAFMLNWRYGTQFKSTDVEFQLSADFNPVPLGADWLRLATEWYQNGLIPRTLWLMLLKQNDMVPADYDDEEGQVEMTQDEVVNKPNSDPNYADKVNQMNSMMNNVSNLKAA